MDSITNRMIDTLREMQRDRMSEIISFGVDDEDYCRERIADEYAALSLAVIAVEKLKEAEP